MFSRPPITIGTKLTRPFGPLGPGAVIGSAPPVETARSSVTTTSVLTQVRQDSTCLVSRNRRVACLQLPKCFKLISRPNVLSHS